MREGRKTLNFDLKDENENEVFVFLDIIRYYQTDFITKLVHDFFEQHSIDVSSDYEIIRRVVMDYIKGKQTIKSTSNSNSTGQQTQPVQDNSMNNDMVTTLLGCMQQLMTQQMLAQQMQVQNMTNYSQPPLMNMPPNPSTPVVTHPIQNENRTPQQSSVVDSYSDEKPGTSIDEQHDAIYDDDEDDDISSVMDLARGISNMLE